MFTATFTEDSATEFRSRRMSSDDNGFRRTMSEYNEQNEIYKISAPSARRYNLILLIIIFQLLTFNFRHLTNLTSASVTARRVICSRLRDAPK